MSDPIRGRAENLYGNLGHADMVSCHHCDGKYCGECKKDIIEQALREEIEKLLKECKDEAEKQIDEVCKDEELQSKCDKYGHGESCSMAWEWFGWAHNKLRKMAED